MDCWVVLGIERFSDKKTIKIAYAKLLKQTRPDEDPEGFQQLHRAYKSALSWVPTPEDDNTEWMNLHENQDDSKNHQGAEPSDKDLAEAIVKSLQRPMDSYLADEERVSQVVAVDKVDFTQSDLVNGLMLDEAEAEAKEELSEADRQLLDEIHGQEHMLSEDWQVFHKRVSEIIKTSSDSNDLKQWKFLDSLVSMNDLEFRKAASDQVFELVAEVNSVALESKHLYVKRPVLNYLNKQFSWDKKWQEYQLIHPKVRLNAVYPYLAEAEKPVKGVSKKRELYYYRRGAAFAIDLSLLFLPVPLYALLKGLLLQVGFADWVQTVSFYELEMLMVWMGIYLLVVIPIQEASKHQATIGKRLLSLQVIDKRGDRIGFIRSFWRGLLTVLCCFGVKIVVFINIILSYWKSELLQDTLSLSYVTFRPGYTDE